MNLDWMMLTNYAEAPPETGLIYIMGGTWDTMTVGAPIEGAPPGVVAVMNGYLAMRLEFHLTELQKERELVMTILDEDGGEIGKIAGTFRPEKKPGVPPSWPHGYNVVFPLIGLPLPRFGLYTIHVTVDGQHLGERGFRVLKGY